MLPIKQWTKQGKIPVVMEITSERGGGRQASTERPWRWRKRRASHAALWGGQEVLSEELRLDWRTEVRKKKEDVGMEGGGPGNDRCKGPEVEAQFDVLKEQQEACVSKGKGVRGQS